MKYLIQILAILVLLTLMACDNQTDEIHVSSDHNFTYMYFDQYDFDGRIGTSSDVVIINKENIIQSNGRISNARTSGVTFHSVSDGLWSDGSVWDQGIVPSPDDSVVILHTVTIDDTAMDVADMKSGQDFGAPEWLRYDIDRFYHSGGMYIDTNAKLVIDYLNNPDCETEMDENTGFINNGYMEIDGIVQMVHQANCQKINNGGQPTGEFYSTNHNNDFINLGYCRLSETGHLIVGDDMILVDGSTMIHDGNTGSTGDDLYLVGDPYVCGVGYLQIMDDIYVYDLEGNRESWTFQELKDSNKICPSLMIGIPSSLPIEITNFYTTKEGNIIFIYITTASEIIADYMVFYGSIDGTTWVEIEDRIPCENAADGAFYKLEYDITDGSLTRIK